MHNTSIDDLDEAPPLTEEALRKPGTQWKIGGKLVSETEGKRAFRKAWRPKVRTNIYIDYDVVEHYKRQAGERGYQTLINAALRRDMENLSSKNELKEFIADAIKAEFEIGRNHLKENSYWSGLLTSIAPAPAVASSTLKPHMSGSIYVLERTDVGGVDQFVNLFDGDFKTHLKPLPRLSAANTGVVETGTVSISGMTYLSVEETSEHSGAPAGLAFVNQPLDPLQVLPMSRKEKRSRA